jgi:RNA polymerase sigma-70 factor (ECF subfamily)
VNDAPDRGAALQRARPGQAGKVSEHDPFAELVARCQQGDTAAFARLVAATQGDTYNLAYSVLHNADEAQDMTQEVYLRAWRALPSFRGESKLQSWLYRITVNACLNRRRQLRKELLLVDRDGGLAELPAKGPSVAERVALRERNQRVWTAVGQLADKYRLVVTLFYQQELSYQEIAALLSLPLGTVKAHLNRARKALANSLRLDEESDHVGL